MNLILKKHSDEHPGEFLRLLDVGSCNVNGTYKEIVPKHWFYVGSDVVSGDNVDIVQLGSYCIQEKSEDYDVVISGQCLEHVAHPWELVFEMVRMLKPGGLIVLTAPWQDVVHRFPIDCWRILPDGMHVMLDDAGIKNIQTYINESDCWGIGQKPSEISQNSKQQTPSLLDRLRIAAGKESTINLLDDAQKVQSNVPDRTISELSLRPMTADDLEDVFSIRNDVRTRSFLHDTDVFSISDAKKWFHEEKPLWFVLVIQDRIVGYIQTSDWDIVSRSIKTGCNIHPDFRRRGIATEAYGIFLKILDSAGWCRVHSDVLVSNTVAVNLYKKLGFSLCSESDSNITMDMSFPRRITGKNVKVISCYGGKRRGHPTNTEDALRLMKFVWQKETEVDNGVHLDTIFVHNLVGENDVISSNSDWQKYKNFVSSLHGRKTRNGFAITIERPNIGLSFGAFDFAIRGFINAYDNWMFIEDDVIPMKNNTMSNCIRQLLSPVSPPVGYVALSLIGAGNGAGRGRRFVIGGHGVTRRELLQDSRAAFAALIDNWKPPIAQESVYDLTDEIETMFSHTIYQLNYIFEDYCDCPNVVGWRYFNSTFSYQPFTKEMLETE